MKSNCNILFWISPLLGLIFCFRHLNLKKSRLVLFFFCLCFGIAFTVGDVRTEGSMDGVSMRLLFESFSDASFMQYFNYVKDYFQFDTGAQDIYLYSVAFFVGCFTNNYHWFFFTLAAVFAFFQIKSLKYFTQDVNYNASYICALLTFLFLWNNIYNINGARYWTASWIAIYSIFKIFYDRKKIYIILTFVTILVHASFAILPIILILTFFLKRFDNFWLIAFCLSWAFSLVAVDFSLFTFDDLNLPFLVSKKLEFYTDPEYISSLTQGSGYYWVSNFFKYLSINYIELLILLIAINLKNIIDKRKKNVVMVMIIVATIANLGMIIPTFGGRLFTMNYTLVAYSFLICFKSIKYKKLIYYLPFVWFMNLFYLYKDLTTVLDLGFILSPVITFIRFAII